MLTKNKHRLGIFLIAMLFAVTGCDSYYKNRAENSTAPITSCNATEMLKINVSTLSLEQKSDICTIMVSTIHRLPPYYLLKDFERLVSLVKSTAADENVNTLATQAMNIVELRGQTKNDIAMQNTFDTVWRIYQNTQTNVTLNDIATALKRANPIATGMSDSALEQYSVSLWRNRGASKQILN